MIAPLYKAHTLLSGANPLIIQGSEISANPEMDFNGLKKRSRPNQKLSITGNNFFRQILRYRSVMNKFHRECRPPLCH